MAGGQERILRGRIRSIQATKKITRAMELIAASRIVKAQQRVCTPPCRTASRSPRWSRTSPRPAASQRRRRCSPGATRSRTTCYVVITADRGLCGGYNAGVQRAAEGEIKADVLAGTRLHDHPRRSQGRGLLPVPRLPARPGVHRLQRPARRYEDAKAIGQHVVELFRQRRGRPRSSSSTPASSRPARRRSCCGRSCR